MRPSCGWFLRSTCVHTAQLRPAMSRGARDGQHTAVPAPFEPLLSPSSGIALCSYSLVLPGCSGSRPCCPTVLLSAAAAAMPSVGACCRCHPVHNSFPLLRCSLARYTPQAPSPVLKTLHVPAVCMPHNRLLPFVRFSSCWALPPAHVACCCPLPATLCPVCFHAPCAPSCPYLTASTHSPIAVRADQFFCISSFHPLSATALCTCVTRQNENGAQGGCSCVTRHAPLEEGQEGCD